MFYTFSQNNTGGNFITDDKSGIDTIVIIEAESAEHANGRALNIGIYFDGCENEQDCPCCGDRWYPVDESDGTSVPELYGESIYEHKSWGIYETATVHYLSGEFKTVVLKQEGKTL